MSPAGPSRLNRGAASRGMGSILSHFRTRGRGAPAFGRGVLHVGLLVQLSYMAMWECRSHPGALLGPQST